MITLQGKGKEFSEIAEEIEQKFQSWLQYSCMTEDKFFKRINQNNFEIQYNQNDSSAWIEFYDSVKIGESIIGNYNNYFEFQSFIVDVVLLLNVIKVKVQESKGNSRTIAKLYECSLRLNDRINNMKGN